jgi:hypothetical protein
MSDVTIPAGDALAIRRLLWDAAAELQSARHEQSEPRHDLIVEAYHWAAVLDDLAGMPPWPAPGEPTADAIRYYEGVAAHLAGRIAALRRLAE